MKRRICGYLVLRMPEHSYDERALGHPRRNPVGSRYYGGVDRMPWADLVAGRASGSLPPGVALLWDELIEWNRGDWDVLLSPHLGKTRELLAYSNASVARNEICAVYSPHLALRKGCMDSPVDVAWLGVDLFLPGYGSIVDQGFFAHPDLFSRFDSDINEEGLIHLESTHIEAYTQEYVRLEAAHHLEPIDDSLADLDRIEIGRIAA